MKSWFYSWIRVQAAVFYRLNRDYEEKSVNMIFYDKNER